MTITQADIIAILKTGTYPISQKSLQYYQQKQKYPIYPFVEVSKVQSDSNTTDIEKTAIEQTFEIRFYMKYTRQEEFEEPDRLATENEMLRVLENNDFIPVGLIFFESKSWNTNIIDESIYGSRSVLRFTIKDSTPTGGVGVIGALDKIELNSQGTPLQIQILSINERKGFSIDTHTSDDRITQYSPERLIKFGEFTITYKQTPAIKAIIDSISASGDFNNGKIIKNGTPTNLTFNIGQTSSQGSYGDVEKATTTFYAKGTW